MKSIDVAKSVGTMLITADSGRDLFSEVLSLYLEDTNENIQLDFSDVITISPEFAKELIGNVRASTKFNYDAFKLNVIFNGLSVSEMMVISSAMSNVGVENDSEVKEKLEEAKKKLGSTDFKKLFARNSHAAEAGQLLSEFLSKIETAVDSK